jgi:hypothetical protein
MAAHPIAGRAATAQPSGPSPTSVDPPPAGPAPATPDPVPSGPPPGPAPSASRDPYLIGLIGDTGYSSGGEQAVHEIAEDMATFPLEFVVHAGDIWAEGTSCSDANYLERRDTFNEFVQPFIYTPGDNEWSDCPQGSSSRLNALRQIFFPTNQTLGRNPGTVHRQPDMVENARWSHNGVWFATLNEPGADGRGGTHRDRNIAWLNETFDGAEANGAAGVMITWQDNPFEPSGGRLARVLKERAMAFGKPVVLVHGDTHRYRIDHPWRDVPHFTRVETHGATSSSVWIRATIDPNSPGVFTFDNERG